MTFEQLRNAWKTNCGSHAAKTVFMALAFHADDKGLCWPSIQTLMRECNLCERAVQSQIRHLSRLGFVQVEQGGGKHRVNHYTVTIPNPAPDTVYQKPRITNPVSHYPNPARRSSNPAPDAPQLSGTAKNGQRGMNGHTPRSYPKDFEILIKAAREEQEKLKNKGAHINAHGTEWHNESARLEFVELSGRIKQWRKQQLSLNP